MNNSDMASYIVATYLVAAVVFVTLWAVSYYNLRKSKKDLKKIKNKKNESKT